MFSEVREKVHWERMGLYGDINHVTVKTLKLEQELKAFSITNAKSTWIFFVDSYLRIFFQDFLFS